MRLPVIFAVGSCGLMIFAAAQTQVMDKDSFSVSSTTDELIGKAETYLKANDYVRGLKTLEDALKFCPGNARLHLEAALKKQREGDFTGAQTEINAAYRGYPKFGLIFYDSGWARLQIGDYYGAVTDLSMAIYIEPKVTLAYVLRGLARHELGDFQGAVQDFTTHIDSSRQPHVEMAYLYRAKAHFENGDGGKALADASTAISMSPDLIAAYTVRSWQHKRNGNIRAAIDDCNVALKAEPQSRHMLRVRMWLYHALGDSKSAHADAEQRLESEPKQSSSWYLRGALYETEDNIEAAFADYRKAVLVADEKSNRGEWIYANFFLDLLNRRTGRVSSNQYLGDVFTWPDDWPKRVAIYLAGHITAESLEKEAKNSASIFTRNRQECEAYYYIGMIKLIGGLTMEAREYFQKSVDTKQAMVIEYDLAQWQLRRLQGRP